MAVERKVERLLREAEEGRLSALEQARARDTRQRRKAAQEDLDRARANREAEEGISPMTETIVPFRHTAPSPVPPTRRRRRKDDGSAPAPAEPPQPKPPFEGGAEAEPEAECWPDDDGLAAGMDERSAFAMSAVND